MTSLQASFLRCYLPTPSYSYTIISDASKAGWGALLLQGSRIIRCASGLWSSAFQHHLSNTLELEALCRACNVFRPWIFAFDVHCVMDNQAAVSLNNPTNLSPFLKRRLEALQWLCPSISFSPGPFNYLADFSPASLHGCLLAQWKVTMRLVELFQSLQHSGSRSMPITLEFSKHF